MRSIQVRNTMRKVFNFSPGPAMLPEEVLLQAQQELLDWHGTGMSPMEMSHRGKEFKEISDHAQATLRELLAIPAHYKVLFLAGGARSQFAMVPINLLHDKTTADYILTGIWSKQAAEEAKKYCHVNVAGRLMQQTPLHLPDQNALTLNPHAAYCYYTDNETIEGAEFNYIPNTGNVPLVSDMTSNLLSRPIDVERFGVIFASAQKNIGHAGITVVIIREDLLGFFMPNMPLLFDYQAQARENSMLNTPPTYSWYFAGLMFDWIKKQGGVAQIAQICDRKIQKIYAKIDGTDFYINGVDKHSRSRMNVPFTLINSALDTAFLTEASQAGLINLAGHRMVGGMRASVYLGMPESGVDALVSFMDYFEKRYG